MLSALQGKFDELEERITQDQRMVRVERWSACMEERGHRYAEPEEIDSDLLTRFQGIVGSGTQPGTTTLVDPGATYDRGQLAALKRDEVKMPARTSPARNARSRRSSWRCGRSTRPRSATETAR